MTISIMQPTYLPWLGYFDLMDQSDAFVFLDSVQFERQSWQQRNRIKVGAELQWLSVPVKHAGRSTQPINEVELQPSVLFPQKHLRTIAQHYQRAPYYDAYFPGLKALMEADVRLLADLNQSIIRWLAAQFGLTTPFLVSSALPVQGARSALLVDILTHLGADHYLSPLGAADYLLADQALFAARGITVSFQAYEHPTYRQGSGPFVPYAAAIDLLFHEGPGALAIVRAGRRPALTLAEVKARPPAILDAPAP